MTNPRSQVIHGLVVPADARRSAHLTPLGSETSGRQLSIAQQLVGGYVEQARYDHDAVLLVDEDGNAHQRPVNVAITHYVKTQSEAAAVHAQRGEPWPAGYVLVGDIVIVGCDARHPDRWTNVPERYLTIFGVALPNA